MEILPAKPGILKNSLKQKLLFSHLSLAGIGVGLLVVALISTLWLRDSTLRLALESGPKFESLKSLESGVQRSLAALRGWVVLGDPAFQNEWIETWSKEIWPSMAELKKLNLALTLLKNQNPLVELKRLFSDLSEWQWRIADVANTPGNEPARVALQHNVMPVVDSIEATLATLIELEKKLQEKGNPQKLLSSMLEFRYLFSRCQGFLIGFVRAANPNEEEQFNRKLDSASRLLRNLNADRDRLTVEQRELLEWVQDEFRAYAFFSQEVLSLRKSDQWNVAQNWLNSQSLPLLRKINDQIQLLSLAVEKEVTLNVREATAFSNVVIPLILLLIVVMIVAAIVVSKYGAEQITKPIEVLVQGTKKFSEGCLTEDIPVSSDDEVGGLTNSFNAMRASLEESYGRTRVIVDSAMDGIITIDGIGNIQSFNPAAEIIFGLKTEQIMGQNFSCLMPQPHGSELGEYLQNYPEADKAEVLGAPRELSGKRKDGSVFPMELSVSEVILGGKPMFISIIRDVSDRKRVEGDLAKYRAHLEDLVEERTRDLKAAQEELVRKERLAMLGELSAKVSHELRNPLGTVRNVFFSLDQLLQGNSKIKPSLAMAERAIIRCNDIIEDLLDYARPHDRNLEMTDIDSWLDEVVDEEAPPDEVTVDKKLIAGVKINLDRERFRRAMINVLCNGYQALMEKHSQREKNLQEKDEYLLFVETRVVKERLEVLVRDTGIGIPQDQLEKILEPLHSTKSFGVGLGLPIVRDILQQHGGGVEIDSQLGESTTVILWLPLSKSENTI